MDSGVLGLGAVAWTDAWNAAAPEAVLRLAVDPARLLELLRGVPASRALLSDLQRLVPTGRTVELLVSADRQVAEIATGTSHHVLTVAARNAVLAVLVGPLRADAPRQPAQAPSSEAAAGARLEPARRDAAAAGILWQSPTATAAQQSNPVLALALPWLGPDAHLQITRDGAGQGGSDQAEDTRVFIATLCLHLPRLGTLAARIRVCGSAVAVSIECEDPGRLAPELSMLSRSLSDRGLVSAYVGAVPKAAP